MHLSNRARFSFFLGSLIFFLLLRSAGAQHHSFTQYNELNGLPSSEVYRTFQDKQGFVWVGTDNGVVRFDGKVMTLFNTSNGLPDHTVFDFFEDHRGKIWFRTYSGLLSYYDPAESAIFPYRYNDLLVDTLRTSILNDVKVDSLEQVWFAPNINGPAGYIDTEGKLHVTETMADTSFVTIRTIDARKNLYSIGIIGGPREIRGVKIDSTYFPVRSDLELITTAVATYAAASDGLYIAFNRTVLRYRDQRVEIVYRSVQPIISLHADRRGAFWVGLLQGGALRFDANWQQQSSLPEVSRLSVTGFMTDREGGSWVSTLEQGVFYFPNVDLETYNNRPDTESSVRAVAFGGRSGRVYVGRENGSLAEMQSLQKQRWLLYNEPYPITGVHEDQAGNLWVAHIGAVIRISADRQSITRTGVSGIRGFFVDPRGRLCGYSGSAAYIFSEAGQVVGRRTLTKRPVQVVSHQSVTYMGTLSGLVAFDANLQPLWGDSVLMRERISCFRTVGDQLLVGTVGNGLFVVSGQRVRKLQSLVNDKATVYSILPVGDRIWVATDGGVWVAHLEDLNRQQPPWQYLTTASGLLTDRSIELAHVGEDVWVFSDRGITRVPKNLGTFSNQLPSIYLRTVKLNNEVVSALPPRLTPEENNLSVDIGVVSFNNRNVRFRHRLRPSQPWSYSSEGNLSYYSLRSGEYRLEIEAALNGGQWARYPQALSFTIRPPWWATWTFRGAMIFLLLLAGVGVYLAWVASVRRKQSYLELINTHQQRLIDAEIQTQERERKRIAKDLHDGVGTALSSIKLMVGDALQSNESERQEKVQEINENLTEVIAEIKRIVYDLHPPALERYGLQVGLKSLAEKINSHGHVNVSYDYYGQREVAPSVSITIYRILQELINNTLKHAKATEIRIHVNQFEDEINIMYEDNGIGMVGSRFSGLGLHSIESRIRSLQGRMSWESNHKGTFYNFDIPFR